MSVLLRSVSCVYGSEMRVNIISVSSGLPDQYCMLLILVQIIATSNNLTSKTQITFSVQMQIINNFEKEP